MVGRLSHKSILFFLFGITISLIHSCVPVSYPSSSDSISALHYDNKAYLPSIHTVRMLTFKNGQVESVNRPVIELNKNQQLRLSFDLLEENNRNLQFRIVHVNEDWTKASNLQAMDYLYEYNQFPINDFEYSFDTKTKYIHYQCVIPEVKISGNYVVVVYQNNNPDDILLSERFMVYEDAAAIGYDVSVSSITGKRQTHQELDFVVQLKDVNVLNPASDITAYVRQNNNWLLSKTLEEPFQINGDRLTYQYYDGRLNFAGANEFRFADISSVNFKGTNVESIDKASEQYQMKLKKDQNRSMEAYREWDDRNGRFVVGNRERSNSTLVADYIAVEFQLDIPKQPTDVYVIGEFSRWELSNEYKMFYNSSNGLYELKTTIKQSYFEYLYYVPQPPYFPFDGNYDDTENEYDILIYYSNPQMRYDKLIGYTHFNSRSAR